MSYNPIFDAMRQAREDANAAHGRVDEDGEGFAFGMGLLAGTFALVFSCIAAKCGGLFPWIVTAILAVLSVGSFSYSFHLFKSGYVDDADGDDPDKC